jgi:hypothetical protein
VNVFASFGCGCAALGNPWSKRSEDFLARVLN